MIVFEVGTEVVRSRDENREVGVVLKYIPRFPRSQEVAKYWCWFPSKGVTNVVVDRLEEAPERKE